MLSTDFKADLQKRTLAAQRARMNTEYDFFVSNVQDQLLSAANAGASSEVFVFRFAENRTRAMDMFAAVNISARATGTTSFDVTASW